MDMTGSANDANDNYLEYAMLEDDSDQSFRRARRYLACFYAISFLVGGAIFFIPLAIFVVCVVTDFDPPVELTWSMFALWNVLTVSNTIFFIRRRNRHPLISRSPGMLFLTLLSCFFLTNWSIIAAQNEDFLGCDGTHWLYNMFYPMFVVPYLLRAHRLYAVFKTQQPHPYQSTLIQESPRIRLSISSASEGQLAWNSNSITSSGETSIHHVKAPLVLQYDLLKKFGIIMLPFIIFSIIDSIYSQVHFLPEFLSGCDPKSPTIIVWCTIHGLEMISFSISVYYLRRVWKAFDTRQELVIIGLICAFFSLAYLIMEILRISLAHERSAITFLVVSRGVGCFMVSIVYPTYATYFSTNLPEFPDRQVLSSLQLILDNESAFDNFQQFLSKKPEYCLLEFWVEVLLLKEDFDEDFPELARDLYDKYFTRKGIDDAVERRRTGGLIFFSALSHTTLERLERQMRSNSFSPGMFDMAQQEVFDQLEAKEYPLYLRSQECKLFLKNLRRSEQLMRRIIHNQLA